jgi:hypothetical protein
VRFSAFAREVFDVWPASTQVEGATVVVGRRKNMVSENFEFGPAPSAPSPGDLFIKYVIPPPFGKIGDAHRKSFSGSFFQL